MTRISALLIFLLHFGLDGISQVHPDGDAVLQTMTNPDYSFLGAPQLTVVEAGDDVEGDFHISPAFQPGSPRCWIAHRTTNNISIIDIDRSELLLTIDTEESPSSIAFTDELALVTCLDRPQLRVYELESYMLHQVIPLQGQPISVKVNRDQTRAMVAINELDQAIVFDLDDLSQVQSFNSFPVGIGSFSFITSNTRSHYAPGGMAISPDGSICVTGGPDGLLICDVTTGSCNTLTDVVNVSNMEFSNDGSKIVAVAYGNEGAIYEIEVMSQQVTQTIRPADRIAWTNGQFALNAEGNRLLLSSQNSGMFVDLDQGDYQIINTGSAVFWTGITADKTVGIAGGFNTHKIDMESGQIIATTSGISLNTGDISTDGEYMLGMDPLRRERADTYLTGGNSIVNLGPVIPGSMLEADATYSVKFSHNDQKLYAVNSLSGTITVFDPVQKSREAMIPLEWYEIYHMAISPNDKWGLVGERLGDQATLIDLENNSVVTDFPTFGSRPDQTFFHPNGEKAYVLNAGGADNMSVVDVTMSTPRTVRNVPTGNTGISWINYGIRCNLSITEDGNRGVLATPFDGEVQIMDLENDAIMESFEIDGFPLRSALSHSINGRIYAAVTLRNDAGVMIIEDIDGRPVSFGKLEIGESPTMLAFDPHTRFFAICCNQDNNIHFVDPENFEVDRIQNFDDGLTPINVAFSEQGDQFTLLRSSEDGLPHQLMINDEMVELPDIPCHYFDVNSDGSQVAIPGIHTDQVFLVETDVTGTWHVNVLDGSKSFDVYPNPFVDYLQIQSIKPQQSPISVSLYSQDGKLLRQSLSNSLQGLQSLPSGIYIYRIHSGEKIWQSGEVIKR